MPPADVTALSPGTPEHQRLLCAIVEQYALEALSGGQASLTEAQRQIVAQLRARQAALDLSAGCETGAG